ncbi:heparinase II/III family protein [Amylostereum chailletii]|nr:heparinase II/III family protein [Amylostereum chailletii]
MAPPKRGLSKWVKIGIPVAIVVIVAAVLGGVLGSRASNNSNEDRSASSGGSSSSSSSGSGKGDGSSGSSAGALGRFATATNSEFLMPVYPSTTNTALFTSPTVKSGASTWPDDSFKPSSPSVTSVRTDRPRLIAPQYKWQALPDLINGNAYLKGWNDSIFQNATQYFSLPVVAYFMDGSSGILDNAREIKMRVKAFSYVYRMTNDTKWSDRAYQEIENAGSRDFGPATDKWNSAHFLDTAEFCAAYAIAYDWLYDILTDDQKSSMRSTLLQYGLTPGLSVYQGDPNGIGWWSGPTVTGNWNCVSNAGIIMASLAILGDDTSGTPEAILNHAVANAVQVCAHGPSSDGTWSETANYWYFGTTGFAEMTSALMTAAGSDFGLLASNPSFNLTGLYHMYVTGLTSLFNYGDHGPNKFSTTANSMLFLADQYNAPLFSLFQRDQHDAPEPWSMFWYNPATQGAFWDGMFLDHFFDNSTDQWGSMRSSWTDTNALYVAMKAGTLQGHQTHNDLDCGDFVLDALGTRWAGELGSGDYNSLDYFTSDAQDATRWLYYRKRTEGQNTIIVDAGNQNVLAAPTVSHDTTGEAQGSSTVYDVPSDSTAYFVADLTSAYFNTTSFKRGIRLINGRKQVLLQDEINAQASVMWRMHTNATVTINSGGTSATLELDGQKMTVELLNAPSGAQFTTLAAERLSTDPALPSGQVDQPNPGVTVLAISLGAGTYSLQVLFNPQWPGASASDFKTPPSVGLAQWSLTSHNS